MTTLPIKFWTGIILTLLLVTWLGARRLNADGLWFDEWWSLYGAGADIFDLSRSPIDIWRRFDVAQGVLYPFLLAGWGSAAGWTVYATRALSLFAGLITLAATFRLGWALSRQPLVGLTALVVLGTSVWFVYFLHELRVYMLLLLFTVLLLLIYHRVMEWSREPRFIDYVALTLVTGLLLNAHYFAGLVVVVVGLWHFVRLLVTRPDRRWWGVIGAWMVAFLMLAPWIVNLPGAIEIAHNEPRVQPDAGLLVEITGDTFYAFSNAGVALLVLLLAFSLLARPARRLWLLVIGLLVLNLAAYYAFSLNELRYNMALLPLLALIVGFGINELAQRRVPSLLILAIWFASGLAVENDFHMLRTIQRWPNQPIREMAVELESRVSPDDVIVNLIGDENRPSLALHPLVHYLGDTRARIEVVENIIFPGTQNFARRVRDAVGDAQRLWLLYDPRWESSEWALFEYLLNEQSLYNCGTLANTDSMLIQAFGRINSEGREWQFGDGIAVSMIGLPRTEAKTLQLWLSYQISDSVPAGTYSTALHVVNQSGQLQAQIDTGLPGAGNSCQYREIALDDFPPGDYQVHMAIYKWQTGERLVSAAPDSTLSDYPVLASVTIPPR